MPTTKLFNLYNKNALVTGGAAGIGRACATALAMGGANIAIVDLDEVAGLKTVADLKAMGVDALFVACDVSDEQQVNAMTTTVVTHFGSLDIAINNAGICIAREDQTQPKKDWDKMLAVNLTGVWLCAKSAGGADDKTAALWWKNYQYRLHSLKTGRRWLSGLCLLQSGGSALNQGIGLSVGRAQYQRQLY